MLCVVDGMIRLNPKYDRWILEHFEYCEKSLHCRHCGREFSSKTSARVHLKEKHLEQDVEFKCPLCGKLSATRSALRMHVNRIHNRSISAKTIAKQSVPKTDPPFPEIVRIKAEGDM